LVFLDNFIFNTCIYVTTVVFNVTKLYPCVVC